MKQQIYNYHGLEIYHLHKPTLKHSYITIKHNGSIYVKTPFSSPSFVKDLITKKLAWIQKAQKKVTQLQPIGTQQYHTRHEISLRVAYFAQQMDLNYSELKFRKMKRRWGSCRSNGVITLNTYLLYIEQELVDYVIVHELAHLVHMNHSKRFYQLLCEYIPDAKDREQRLHKYLLSNS